MIDGNRLTATNENIYLSHMHILTGQICKVQASRAHRRILLLYWHKGLYQKHRHRTDSPVTDDDDDDHCDEEDQAGCCRADDQR